MTTGRWMKVKSIAECSKGSILQYLWPALSDNLEKQFLVFLRKAIFDGFYCSWYIYKHLQACVLQYPNSGQYSPISVW